MTRQGLRLVVRLSLAIMLVANGPVNPAALATVAAALQSAHGPTSPCRDSGRDEESACCCPGCCCAADADAEESRNSSAVCEGSGGSARDQAGVGPGSTCPARPSYPHCPYCPACPGGCSGCCPAKAPCCLTDSPTGVAAAPCLGDCLADLSPIIPSAPAREVFQPPRA